MTTLSMANATIQSIVDAVTSAVIPRASRQTSHYTIQSTSRQDFAISGSTRDFHYLVVADGHGHRLNGMLIPTLLKSYDWATLLCNSNFYKTDKDARGNHISPLFRDIKRLVGPDRGDRLCNQGSTLSIVKIYPDRFECFWIGDSTIKIYAETDDSQAAAADVPSVSANAAKTMTAISTAAINATDASGITIMSANTVNRQFSCIMESENHNMSHAEDMQRLKSRSKQERMWCRQLWKTTNGITTKNVWSLHVLSPKKITMVPHCYVDFDDGTSINMTRSIGHIPDYKTIASAKELGIKLSLAQQTLTTRTIARDKNVKYCVLAATDGLWDITCAQDDNIFTTLMAEGHIATAAKYIAQFAKRRWAQTWTQVYKGYDDTKTAMPRYSHDDIGVAIWSSPSPSP